MWTVALYRLAYRPSRFSWFEGWRILGGGVCIHQTNQADSQWLVMCCDDSIANIETVIIIIIIIINIIIRVLLLIDRLTG